MHLQIYLHHLYYFVMFMHCTCSGCIQVLQAEVIHSSAGHPLKCMDWSPWAQPWVFQRSTHMQYRERMIWILHLELIFELVFKISSARGNIDPFAFLLENDTFRIIDTWNHVPPKRTSLWSRKLCFWNTTVFLSMCKCIFGTIFFVPSKKVYMCSFNPSETSNTEQVKNHHCKEVKENKRISEERRYSATVITGKGILKKNHQLIYFYLLSCEMI